MDRQQIQHPPEAVLLRNRLQHAVGVMEMTAQELERLVQSGEVPHWTSAATTLAVLVVGLREAVEAATKPPPPVGPRPWWQDG